MRLDGTGVDAEHQHQKQEYGEADAPGQRLDGAGAPAIVLDQKDQAAGQTAEDGDEYQDDEYLQQHAGVRG